VCILTIRAERTLGGANIKHTLTLWMIFAGESILKVTQYAGHCLAKGNNDTLTTKLKMTMSYALAGRHHYR